MTTTNKIIFKKEHKFKGETGPEKLQVTICLDDECGNGHEDFSITGILYEKHQGRHWDEWREVTGGAIGEEISERLPQYRIFNELHLADWEGTPMHGPGNMYYHLGRKTDGGFDGEHLMDPSKFQTYYMVTAAQYEALKEVDSEVHLRILIRELGIKDTWEKKAKTAIRTLEKWTGKKFESKATKRHWKEPTAEEIRDYERKRDSGYYTPEAHKARMQERKEAEVARNREVLEARRARDIAKIEREYSIDSAVLDVTGGPTGVDSSIIYYAHTDSLCFNWSSRKRWTKEDAEKVFKDVNRKLEKPISTFEMRDK